MARNAALDIAKGIAIILVIIGHCWEIPYMPYRHFIFTFHMPLFFLISGYLYKQKDIKESLIKDFKRLMIPYVVTCIVILIFHAIAWVVKGDSSTFKTYAIASLWGSGTRHDCLLGPNPPSIGAVWFLPALLICKNVYNILPQKGRLIYSSAIFLTATILGRYVIYLPFSILSGLSAIIFYAIGDYLKKVNNIKWYFWIFGFICWGLSCKYSHIYIVTPRLDLYFIDVIGATAISILVYRVSREIAKTKFVSKTLSWIGESSLYILCFHLIDLDCHISSRVNFTGNIYVTLLLKIILPVLGAAVLNLLRSRIKPLITHD